MMKLCTFVLCCTLFSSIAAFVVPDGFTELKNSSKLPSILHQYDTCEGLDCNGNGECYITDTDPTCKCYDRYEGINCEIDKCEGFDCNGNGECKITDTDTICKCYERYEGKYCEIDKCEGLDCNGNGECEIIDTDPTCKCYNRYEGKYCEIDKCEGLDCNGNGECEITDTDTICKCNDRYEGKYCKIDKCEGFDCNGNGECEIIDTDRTCKCYDRYEGKYCEIDKCEGLGCNGNGECLIADMIPTCQCNKRYVGQNCEIDKCDGLDCNGHGECEIIGAVPICKCYDRYDGKNCEIVNIDCINEKPKCIETGGTCKFDSHDLKYIECACPSGSIYTEDEGCIDATVPRNLRATWYSNTSICLKWDEPLVLTAPILCYEIHWLNSTGNGWDRSVSNNTSYTMKHLAPFVEYSFRVAAVTKTGTGSMSENFDIRTAVGVPHAPRNLTVTRMTNKTAELIWNEPLISTGPIITYRVHWQNSSSTGEEETRSTATFYTVRNLTPNVNYTFKVMALTEAGPGEWSGRVTGQTKMGDKCSDVTCQNGGKCIIKRGKAVCKCTDKYTGNFCETDLTSLDDPDDNIFISVFFKNKSLSTDSKLDFHFSRKETSNRTITELLLRLNSKSVVRPPDDKCSLISCKNGGTCEVKNEKAVCTCPAEYTGDYCEKSKCSLIKCQNNGKCQLKNEKAICACTDNYSGEYCEYHKCSLMKCKNGGKCEVKYGEAVCICPDSYTGDYCETDKCSLVGCKNGGKCVIINGKAICNCLDNYTGDLCATDKCSLIRCHNGGKCDIKNGKAVCVCKDEHIGDFCEIDKCSLIRCLNGGKCEIENKKAVCICNDEFTGDYCEKRIY